MNTVICSAYCTVLHSGHIDYFRKASEIGDHVICILNNDNQLLNKYGFIPVNQDERKKIVEAIKYVNEVVIAVDKDQSVAATIHRIFPAISHTRCLFINSGDRQESNSNKAEVDICNKLGIIQMYLGDKKVNSSSSICERICRYYGKEKHYRNFNGERKDEDCGIGR